MMQHSGSATVRQLIWPGFEEKARAKTLAGAETVQHFLDRTEWKFALPTICSLNGSPVMRSEWASTLILPHDDVVFLSRPYGGHSSGKLKSVLGIVAMIALVAVAPYLGGVGWTALGLYGTAPAWVSAGIVIAGSLLISTLLAPKAPQTPTDPGAISQLYSLSASGNTGKLLQPIPVGYGTLKDFPDYAANPWSEFIGDDQYLNVTLCLGCGKYKVHKLYIDDTEMWDETTGFAPAFTTVEQAYYNPGENIDLFPINVSQAVEVSGQELIDPADISGPWIGPFIANDAGTQAQALAVDIAFSGGLFSLDDQGNIQAASVTVVSQYQAVDDAGAPVDGTWLDFDTTTYTLASRNPKRFTIKKDVGLGRYQVRVKRTTAPATSGSISDGVTWISLRAFIHGPSSFAKSATQAIRIKANAQLSQNSSKRFGVLWTRILPVWDGTQFVEQQTQNPIWAFYDSATNTTYGAKRPISKVDFGLVVSEATASAARGDTFNYKFAAAQPVPQAFDTILKTTRAKHRWAGDVLSFIRDEWKPVPQMLLTDQQIVRGTFNQDYIFNDETASDSVVVQYLDENIWGPAQVQYPPNSDTFTSVAPSNMQIDGITNREHAKREAAFWYLQAQLRRIQVTLSTEHDGRILNLGSTVMVQSDMPQTWGSVGKVLSSAAGALTLYPAPDWSGAGLHYITLRTRTGGSFGPIKVTQGADATIAELDSADLTTVEGQTGLTLAEVLDREDGAEDPIYSFGSGSAVARRCIVLTGSPNGDQVALTMVTDVEEVHTTTLDDVPALPSPPTLTTPRVPVIGGALMASFVQGVAEPQLFVSWQQTNGAMGYLAQISQDGGASWQDVYQGIASQFQKVVPLANTTIRVQAIGVSGLYGPFIATAVEAPTIAIQRSSLAADIQAQLAQVPVVLQEILDGQVVRDANALAESVLNLSQSIISGTEAQERWNQFHHEAVSAIAGTLSAQVAQEILARTTAIDAEAQARTALAAQVNDPTTGLSATNVRVDAVLVSLGDKASASSVTALAAEVHDASTGLATKASISSVSAVSATVSGKADASVVTTLSNLVNDPTTGLATKASLTTVSSVQTDVNGVKLQFGVLGTINGVTGGFGFTGVGKLDGSVTYALEINANVLVNGSITATKIAAGNIQASHLAADVFTAVNANITNLTATNINSNYAIYNTGTNISGFADVPIVHDNNATPPGGYGPYTIGVFDFSFTPPDGLCLCWAGFHTGTLFTIGNSGHTPIHNPDGSLSLPVILRWSLVMTITDVTDGNTVLSTSVIKALDAAHLGGGSTSNISGAGSAVIGVTPGHVVNIHMDVVAYADNMTTSSTQFYYEIPFDSLFGLVLQPHGIL